MNIICVAQLLDLLTSLMIGRKYPCMTNINNTTKLMFGLDENYLRNLEIILGDSLHVAAL